MDAEYTGTQIAACRKARGMTQKALAERLHVTDKAVSKWERGLNFPDLTLIEPLAEALDTTPAALLGLEHARQEEIVTSMTELSGEQLEDARRDNSRTGWGCLVLALVLMLVYHPRRKRRGIQAAGLSVSALRHRGYFSVRGFSAV